MAQTNDEVDYRLGEKARADIVTPVDLVVFDAARTEQLRQAEAARVPPIYRFDSMANREAEAALRQKFADARRRFLDAIETRFHRRVLATSELSSPSFSEIVAAFAVQERELPMNLNLAELWVLGDPADVVLDRLLARLEQLLRRPIRGEGMPDGEVSSVGTVCLVPVSNTRTPLDMATTERTGKTVPESSLVTVAGLVEELQRSDRLEERLSSGLLARLLRPNCFFEPDLTRQAKAKRTEAINAVDRYPAGATIARKGQSIDARTQRALAELKSRTAAERIKVVAEVEKKRLAAEAAANQSAVVRAAAVQTAEVRSRAERVSRQNQRLAAGLVGALALCGILGWLWVRRRRALAKPAGASLLPVLAADADESVWRERALVAEARADKATAMLRARLLPQLARWMMSEMLGRLLSQRGALLSSQQQAEREVAELAARLDGVHAPLEERLRAYEQRVAELEAALAIKDQQNRELIQAKIEAARGKLAQERGSPPPNWN